MTVSGQFLEDRPGHLGRGEQAGGVDGPGECPFAVALARGWGDVVDAVVLTNGHARHLPSRPGVAGLRMDPPGRHDLVVPPGSTIVLHTDGVDSRWLLESPARATLPPPLLAAA